MLLLSRGTKLPGNCLRDLSYLEGQSLIKNKQTNKKTIGIEAFGGCVSLTGHKVVFHSLFKSPPSLHKSQWVCWSSGAGSSEVCKQDPKHGRHMLSFLQLPAEWNINYDLRPLPHSVSPTSPLPGAQPPRKEA